LQAVNEGGSPYFGFMLTASISIALAATGAFSLVFGLIGILTRSRPARRDFVLRTAPSRADLRVRSAPARPLASGSSCRIDGTLLVLFAVTDRRGAVSPLRCVFSACHWG